MKVYSLLLMIVFLSSYGFSQIELSRLTIPTSPASSAIGIQPNQILRPKSYQALETALYSNFFDGSDGAIIPKDFALEFTPYWAKNRGLSLKDYVDPKFGQQFVRNSSFSIATTQSFLLEDSSKMNGIGFGYRTSFFISGPNDKKKIEELTAKIERDGDLYVGINRKILSIIYTDSNYDNLDAILNAIRPIITDALYTQVYNIQNPKEKSEADQVVNGIINSVRELSYSKDNRDDFFAKLYILIANKLDLNVGFDEYKSYLLSRQGFSIDVAYASFIGFPTGNFEFSYLPHHYFWLTPSYNFKSKLDGVKISASGVIRLEYYNSRFYDAYFPNSSVYANNVDYGLGISADYKKFSMQFELVGRESFGFVKAGVDTDGEYLYKWNSRSDVQYIGTFNYNISPSIVIAYSIGNRFDPIRNSKSTFVSTLSLNFGFGGPTEKDIVDKK
jgi:hypothetical protein